MFKPKLVFKLEFKLSGLTPAHVSLLTEIVNQVVGEVKFTSFKEFLPSDSLSPVTQTFVLVGTV